jgi:hypothetical protein
VSLAGLDFDGATLTGFDDLELDRGTLGNAVWSPSQLLRDLELRLGLSSEVVPEALRVAHWIARITEVASALARNDPAVLARMGPGLNRQA